MGYRGVGVRLRECNHGTKGNATKSESDVQQAERVTGESTTMGSAGTVKGLSTMGRTRPKERDPYFDGKAVRTVTFSPAKDVTTPGKLPARVTAFPPSELITV